MIYIKILKFVFGCLFISFVVAYCIGYSGYYEYRLSKKKEVTSEMISIFEQDIKDGKDIDINDYLVDDKIDYSNRLSRTTYKYSYKLNNMLNKSIKFMFKYINKLVED